MRFFLVSGLVADVGGARSQSPSSTRCTIHRASAPLSQRFFSMASRSRASRPSVPQWGCSASFFRA